uniref:Uncharacterized protein n=1 Tax=Arundo donax TaxID=35708 RepID=A0A0A9GKW9_ARUDO
MISAVCRLGAFLIKTAVMLLPFPFLKKSVGIYSDI